MTVTINGSGTIGGISVGGLNDNIITKNEMATGGAWAPAGTVLQVVQGTLSTSFSTTSTTDVSTGLNASITPSSASSKILVIVTANCRATGGAVTNAYFIPGIYKNTSTQVWTGYAQGGNFGSTDFRSPAAIAYLDSPATTSSTNYLFSIAMIYGSSSAWINNGGGTSTITLMEIAA